MLLACLLSVVLDLGSKELAFRYVAPNPVVVDKTQVQWVAKNVDPRALTQMVVPAHPPMVVIPSLLDFQLVLNPGAVFGTGPGNRGFFMGFTILALGFATWMFARWTGPRDHFAHVAIGMLIGGGIGNLYDRLVHACVRDFIHPLPGMKWPGGFTLSGTDEVWPYVSNIADLFLLIGIVMLLAYLWKKDRSTKPA
jgi:lipoprotein signal peptidase